MAADLGAFSDPAFDPKQYINAATAAKRGDEPLERSLAELEMRLHLGAEDVALYLQDHSARAAARPGAVRELLQVQGDVASLRAAVQGTLAQLQAAERGGAATAVAALEELDTVKQRMEAACSTLKEAAGLSALFQGVDAHFASGDVARLSEALAGMRRGLAVVGDSVAEFRGGKERLAQLEERFAAMVEGPLATALGAQQEEDVRRLCGMLEGVGRVDAVERLYCQSRLPQLQAVWESYTPGVPYASWLPTFYDQVAHSLESEAGWVWGALPGRAPALLLALLSALVGKVEKPFRQRLAVAMAGAQGSVLPLEHLEQCQAATLEFGAALFRVLHAPPAAAGGGKGTPMAAAGGVDAVALAGVFSRLQAPLEDALMQYAEREQAYLGAELQQLAAKASRAAAEGDGAAAQLEASVAPALAVCGAAVERCLRLTEGTALPALVRALDRVLQQYCTALKLAVTALQGRLAEGGAGGGEGLEETEAVLPLLLVAQQLGQRLAAFEGSLRQKVCEAVPPLLALGEAGTVGADGAPSIAALRLEAQPALRQQLAACLAKAAPAEGSPAAALLPHAASGAADFEAHVAACVLAALTARPSQQLAGVQALPEWQQRQGGGMALPTFSAYPLQYATSVGEHLLMLPQLLESALLTDESGEEAGGQLVADWIDKVALSTGQAYLQQLGALHGLSPQGATQLGADLEYFCNVLATLGVPPPPALAAWQAAAAAPEEGFVAVREAAAEGGSPESGAAVELVARLRGL